MHDGMLMQEDKDQRLKTKDKWMGGIGSAGKLKC